MSISQEYLLIGLDQNEAIHGRTQCNSDVYAPGVQQGDLLVLRHQWHAISLAGCQEVCELFPAFLPAFGKSARQPSVASNNFQSWILSALNACMTVCRATREHLIMARLTILLQNLLMSGESCSLISAKNLKCMMSF